jgi:predicted P-loop ATPase/GTPase
MFDTIPDSGHSGWQNYNNLRRARVTQMKVFRSIVKIAIYL